MQANSQKTLVRDLQNLQNKIEMLVQQYLDLQDAHQALEMKYQLLLSRQEEAATRLENVLKKLAKNEHL